MFRFRFGTFFASLRAQLVLAMVLMTLVTVMAVAAIGLQRINAKIAEDIETRTLWSLRVAVRVFAEGAPVFQVEKNAAGEPDRLKLTTAATMLDNFSAGEMMKIVDSISEANRGTATYFRWNEGKKDFVRIATTVLKPDGTRAVGTVLGEGGIVYPYMMRGEPYRGAATILGELYQTGYLPIVDAKGQPAGILYIGVGKTADLSASSTAMMRDLVTGSMLVIALAILMTLFLTARLLRPLGRVATATTALANGEEGVTIPHRERQDQIGILARAIEGFSEAVSHQRAQELQNIEDARRVAARKDEMDRMVGEFRETISQYLRQLQAGADKVRATSQDIRDVVQQADTRVVEGRGAAEAGAEAISEVATATNQFASSITEIAARSNDAAGIVRRASETGQHAESVASELTDAVSKIATAVAFISSIASQTNLLALNATIEAARAGEAGRGFAVVASEVKELSNGTSKAATEIAELVKSIEGVTGAVTSATREIGQGLGAINETTLVIAAAVTEQEQVTRDIASNADSAAQRSDVILAGFSEVQRAIENTSTAAGALDALSAEFASSSEQLVTEIEGFLQRMAA